jgi:hypothetical protein
MKCIWFVILILQISFYFGCSERIRKKDNVPMAEKIYTPSTSNWDSLIPLKEVFSTDTEFVKINSDISEFEDNSINGIYYGDVESVYKVLGKDVEMISDSVLELDERDFPRIQVITENKKQLATCYMYYGDAKNQYRLFRVRYLDPDRKFVKQPYVIKDEEFKTGRGVKLGMSKAELIMLFGKPSGEMTDVGLDRVSYQEKKGLYYGDYFF